MPRNTASPACAIRAASPPTSRTKLLMVTWPAKRSNRPNSLSTPNGVAETMKMIEVENSIAAGAISDGHFSHGPTIRQPIMPMVTPTRELIRSRSPVKRSTRWKSKLSPSARGLAP